MEYIKSNMRMYNEWMAIKHFVISINFIHFLYHFTTNYTFC